MARIRTIKPEFWTSEQVMELSPMARLLFIGMWNFCDDRGVHPVAFKTLKAEVFPADDVTAAQVEQWVGEMIQQCLLETFSDDQGRLWWSVTGWHHQLINRPSKTRYPEPPRNAPLPSAAGSDSDESGENPISDSTNHGVLTESSLRTHGVLTESSLTEGKGREGNNPPTPRPGGESSFSAKPNHTPDGLNEVAWELWMDYRKQIRRPIKPVSVPAAQLKLAAYGEDQAEVVEQSIANGWQGLFEPRKAAKKPEKESPIVYI